MPLVVIDLFEDSEETTETKKAPLVKEEPLKERKRLRQQVININGEVVDI